MAECLRILPVVARLGVLTHSAAHGRAHIVELVMKGMKRIVVFGLVTGTAWAAERFWLSSTQPKLTSSLAVQQLNGGEAVAEKLRTMQNYADAVPVIAWAVTVGAAIVCFAPWWRKVGGFFRSVFAQTTLAKKLGKVALLALLPLPLTTGCIKPFDRPEYVEIDTSETGFLIPLEGDATQQAKFQSEDYLKQRKVATKRVQITHRWSQEGRFEHDGHWIGNVRLVKVNRSPVTREWTTEQGPHLSTLARRSDKAIWIESADSVGFSMGFTCRRSLPRMTRRNSSTGIQADRSRR